MGMEVGTLLAFRHHLRQRYRAERCLQKFMKGLKKKNLTKEEYLSPKKRSVKDQHDTLKSGQ